MVIAEGAIPSGFARVATSLFERLLPRFEIHQLTPHALPTDRPLDDPPWPIAALPSPGEPMGEPRIFAAVEKLRPDLVWILADVQIVREYVRLLDPLRRDSGARLVAYCPIDLTPLPPELVAPLAGLDALVAYTEYGRQALGVALPPGAAARLLAIPHGVDTATFYPTDRREARKSLLGEDHADDFIVLNANRNQPRKRIDLSVRGFAKFAKGKPNNVRLHLHMGMRDRAWPIRELVGRLVQRGQGGARSSDPDAGGRGAGGAREAAGERRPAAGGSVGGDLGFGAQRRGERRSAAPEGQFIHF